MNIEGGWSLALLENFSLLLKPSFRKGYNAKDRKSYKSNLNVKPRLSFFLFEDFQEENKEDFKKFLKLLDNFFNYYSKLKYLEDDFLESGWLTLKQFDLNVNKIQSCKLLEDTGLIIGQIITDIVEERGNIKSFINDNVKFNKY